MPGSSNEDARARHPHGQGTTATTGESASRHAALLRLLRAIHVASIDQADRQATLAQVLAAACQYLEWPLGHVYLLEPSSGLLRPTHIWHEESPGEFASFLDATATTGLEPGQGLPGHALASRRPAWLSDLERRPSFLRRDAARAAGLRSGLAAPVFANDTVAAVLEFFAPTTEPPRDDAIAVLEYLGLASQSIVEVGQLEEELTHSAARFQALFRAAADAIILGDSEGRIVAWNPSATRMFGYAPDDILGQPLTRIMPEAYREAHRAAFATALATTPRTTTGEVLELEGLTADGRVFPLELSLASWDEGERYFAGIVREITQRKAAEGQLRLIESAAAHGRDAIVVSTAGGSGRGPTILYVNAAFVRMTGYSESEALGRSFSLLAGEETDRVLLRSTYERIRTGSAAVAELTAYRKDGSRFALDWRASPIYEPDGSVKHLASIQRDVTEERRVEKALRKADRDPLTGLPNRAVLERSLRRSIERVQEGRDYRYALLFMDLDGFKSVNDEHGHVVGDQLLSSAARRLERAVRPGDIVARFGGDEFVILLEYVTGISDVVMVAERVQERLGAPFEVQEARLHVAASIGVALSESGYDTPEEVIRDADAAMYEAKRKGKGRVEFHDRSLYTEVVSVLGLQEDLRQCVERDELELRYQPLVELETDTITGFEALVRWRHPELGLLPPERFVPLAEESGHIVPIGRWVLQEACSAAARWAPPAGADRAPVLSVNLSVREIASHDFVRSVEEALAKTGLDPGRLQLELTESVFIEAPESVRDRIRALRELGVTVCIDDFGTGYSSLGYLHHLPVDVIKIDRLFVHNLDATPGNLEILRTILALARTLDLDVVAEGLETKGQLASLKEMACGYGQGFLFSQPVRPDEVEALLTRTASRGVD